MLIRGTDADGFPVSELTRTASVNAHGGLILLTPSLKEGQALSIENEHQREAGLESSENTAMGEWQVRNGRRVHGQGRLIVGNLLCTASNG